MTLRKELQQLDKTDLYRVLWYVRYKTALHKIRQTKVQQIIVPVALLQIITFVLFVSKSLYVLAIANMVIVGIALLPFALHRPKQKYHWVRGSE